MKTEKTISLTAYTVEYIDQREPKPRTVVLDGGKISALNRLDMRPAGYIIQQFERSGFTVSAIRKGETVTACIDLAELWHNTTAAAELAETKKQLARVIEQLREAEE